MDSIDNPVFLIPVTDILAINLQFHTRESGFSTNRLNHNGTLKEINKP